MATARRVIFSTYVIPTKIVDMEETTIKHEEFLGSTSSDSLTKTLGGRGIATIYKEQWGDEWVSTTHGTINKWEEFTDVFWEDVLLYPTKSGRVVVPASNASPSYLQLTTDATRCAFLYVKNLGSTNKATMSLNGSGGSYYTVIPPEGSVHLRGASTLECNEVYLQCASGQTTEIEYIVAQIS